jgi:hypothetical protein
VFRIVTYVVIVQWIHVRRQCDAEHVDATPGDVTPVHIDNDG